jgi:beta-N-acetylhexosaminidase
MGDDMVGDGLRWWVRGVVGMAVLMGLAGCLSGPSHGGRDGSLLHVRSSAERAALERKIGQMILVGFRGMSVDDAGLVVEQIRAGQVGGVVLFDVQARNSQPVRNIHSPEQVRMLVNGLQRAAGGELLVAVDQEGGRVTRLKEQYGFAASMSQRELAARGVKATGEQAAVTARVLSQVGINVNLAPVVDLDVNPESRQSEPSVVAFPLTPSS